MNTASSTPAELDTTVADSPLVIRYRTAYLEAKVTITCGRFVELCGWILGVLCVIGGALLLTKNTQEGVGVIVAGVLVMVIFRLLGAMGCAIGQMLRATLDTAVFSAPFLDEQQKKRIVGI